MNLKILKINLVPRRTKIIDAVLNYNIEETIQKESVVISITNQGYIKRSPLSALKAQKRGGKGKSGISTREEDFVVQIFTANTHTPVLFFSTQGLAYKIKAHKIPEGTAASKGKSIFNILPLKKSSCNKFNHASYLKMNLNGKNLWLYLQPQKEM